MSSRFLRMLDTRMLISSQKPKELKDSYVIFITENDYFDKSNPIYCINRTLESREMFNDGSHIIYVNGDYQGDDDIGRLISDMKNRTTKGFNYKELEEGVKHFKENKEGRKTMSEAVEKFAEKYAEKYAEKKYDSGRKESKAEDIRALMKNLKCSAEKAMEYIGIPKSEYSNYMKML